LRRIETADTLLGMNQSIRNRIPGTIREITSDKVLTEVVLETTVGPVAAVITTRSVNELGLKVGDSVYALVKATNVSVEKDPFYRGADKLR
jgi:molybdopterin-binding protein